ncbi:12974_t:CDS:10 [Acaulospora morrowiae]|uniref:Ribosomal RNA-processing protein 44 n=1 Tax=Acaulospora morrowiae TaxID=94023 RepID=A0A9N8VBW5_9GLOM|nr:12974_t:CDS:10 [Acaulospora morrowiae]
MLHSKTFLKRTKKGNAVKTVREHYLRDDIWCSAEICLLCAHTEPVLSANALFTQLLNAPHYIVPDTNVFLNQIYFLEHQAIHDVIVLQTVYEDLRNLSLSVYNRLRTLINDKSRRFYVFPNEHHRETYTERKKEEPLNEWKGRAIRSAVKWYSTHLEKASNSGNIIEVALLSDDVENINNAKAEGILAFSVSTVKEYVVGMTDYPDLINMVENFVDIEKDKKICYEEHFNATKISNGLKNGTLYQGSLNISMHNYLEGSILSTVEGVDTQILILGRLYLNRAIQGDVVAVQLLPKSEWSRAPTSAVVEEDEEGDASTELKDEQLGKVANEDIEKPKPTGKVVGIIKKNWRSYPLSYCGYINSKFIKGSATSTISENVFVSAMDTRIPRINIRTRQAKNLLGKRILVAIDSWPKDSKYPLGHFVRALGEAGNKDTETEVLLLEHDVPFQEFTQQVLKNLPPEGENWKVKKEHLRDRLDLRHLNICSIDPPKCTDIDDALHARLLPNGNYEVGVHIADVTHFVKEGTPLDEEAANRGTTVYLVDKRIDMLPPLLGTNLCSLHERKDRLSFSCIWELNSEAEIVNVTFSKSVISSKASLTYEQAQMRIDDLKMQDDLTKSIRILNELAKKLRQRRLIKGALVLASPEVRFQLDFDSQDPVDIEMKESRETNALVEEFMLLANISVAEKIHSKFSKSALLRNHPSPIKEKLEELAKALSSFGLSMRFDSSKSLSDSLDKAVIKGDSYFNTLLRILTTRCMLPAAYICSGSFEAKDYKHYGLATNIYTHFTSPIRRYSDVIVHRMLAASISPDQAYSNKLTDTRKIQELCETLNHRHRMAQMAARSSVELHTNIYFKGKVEENNGYVARILKNGFIVLIPKYGIEGIVYFPKNQTSSNTTPPVVYNSHDNCLESTTETGSKISIKLFDQVTVQVSVQGEAIQKLKIELLKPFIHGFSVSTDSTKNNNDADVMDIDEDESNSLDKKNRSKKKESRESSSGGGSGKRKKIKG